VRGALVEGRFGRWELAVMSRPRSLAWRGASTRKVGNDRVPRGEQLDGRGHCSSMRDRSAAAWSDLSGGLGAGLDSAKEFAWREMPAHLTVALAGSMDPVSVQQSVVPRGELLVAGTVVAFVSGYRPNWSKTYKPLILPFCLEGAVDKSPRNPGFFVPRQPPNTRFLRRESRLFASGQAFRGQSSGIRLVYEAIRVAEANHELAAVSENIYG